MIPPNSTSLPGDSDVENLMGWLMFGPFEFAEGKPKLVRLLALLLWFPWFIVCLPLMVILLPFLTWEAI